MTAQRTSTERAARDDAPPRRALLALAEAHGIVHTYRDGMGVERTAPASAIVKVLRALGAEIDGEDDAPRALEARLRFLQRPHLDAVTVAWQGERNIARLVSDERPTRLDLELHLEDGETLRQSVAADAIELHETPSPFGGGAPRRTFLVPLPHLPLGQHRLALRVDGAAHEGHVIAAPVAAPAFPPEQVPTWGVFAPLYALQTSGREPIGDLTTLRRFLDLVANSGGRIASTLPLLPAFLQDRLHDVSPYAPVSRRFWHELYVDPAVEPEHDHPDVQRLLVDPERSGERARLADGPLVDPGAAMRWKRPLLDEMARVLHETESDRRLAWQDWLRAHPEAETYARFRAAAETRDAPWQEWGDVDAALTDAPPERVRTHAYVQWVAARQMDALGTHARTRGLRLVLDLPLGVHNGGYDAWRDRDMYADGVATGAPPDGFFVHGQDWGFAPHHPERLRSAGYAPLLAALRHHAGPAGVLRVDHVMGLHRLFWVPHGHRATDGVYVTYPAEELYALLTLVATQQRAMIVGEDLGTVPDDVPPALHRHGIYRSYVLQIEAGLGDGTPAAPGPGVLASLNTHDMPPFASFWSGHEINDRLDRGLLDPADAERERRARSGLTARFAEHLGRQTTQAAAGPAGGADGDRLHRAFTDAVLLLAGSAAPVVLVDLIDFLGETEPHNRPGTPSDAERSPNWRRRIGRTLEALAHDDTLLDLLHRLDATRRRSVPPP